MLNHITIMGRITRDIELRRTNSGIPVASFNVAVDRDYSGKDGGEKETDFIDCVAWGTQAESLANYQKKGSLILVKGRIQKRQYQNQEGENRYAVEVVANQILFMPKNGNNDAPPPIEDDEAPF